jgi:hypothetical protein
MKKHKMLLLAAGYLLTFSACAPKVTTSISNRHDTLGYRDEVLVFGVKDSVPDNSEVLGTVKIGDSGFTTDCGWDEVVGLAKLEARKVGGNGIKIAKHAPPNIFTGTCHRITANILRVQNANSVGADTAVGALVGADYALLHIYRLRGAGALVSYDLHLGDSLICRVSNGWKETIKVSKGGANVLWAHTESTAELPANIQLGHEYYVRCGVKMGLFVGRPKLEFVSSSTGKEELQSIQQKSPQTKNK